MYACVRVRVRVRVRVCVCTSLHDARQVIFVLCVCTRLNVYACARNTMHIHTCGVEHVFEPGGGAVPPPALPPPPGSVARVLNHLEKYGPRKCVLFCERVCGHKYSPVHV